MENHRSDGSSTRPIFKPRFRVQEGNMKKCYTCIDCGASCQFVSRFATNRKLGYRCFSILLVFSKLSRKVEIPRGGEPLAKRLTAVAAKRRVARVSRSVQQKRATASSATLFEKAVIVQILYTNTHSLEEGEKRGHRSKGTTKVAINAICWKNGR